jgi:DNA-binding CsgD family transcriptional regulator
LILRFACCKQHLDDGGMSLTSNTNAVARLEAAIFEPDNLADTLRMVGEDLGFDHFCVVHSNIRDLQVIAADHSAAGLKAYEAGGWVETDYRAATVNLFPARRLYLDHLVVPEDQRQNSEIYHELYVPENMAYFAGWSTSLASQSWILSLARAEKKGAVGSDEARALTELMPHASRTLAFAKQVRDIRAQSINDFGTQLGIPLIMLDNEGRAVAISPQAERLFDNEFGIRKGRLWAADSESNNNIDTLMRTARGLSIPDQINRPVVVHRSERGPLLLRPIAIRGLGLDVLPGARLFVTVTDLSQAPTVPEHDLRLIFGLSLAEANVTALLATGCDVNEIAAERQSSVATVRTQIKQVFRKTGVRRIGELVSLVASVMRLKDGGSQR